MERSAECSFIRRRVNRRDCGCWQILRKWTSNFCADGHLTPDYVRLEVGTAHRYNVEETIQIDNQALIIYPVRFVQVAPVGRCPPLNERLIIRMSSRMHKRFTKQSQCLFRVI